jgi:hypothetical protein
LAARLASDCEADLHREAKRAYRAYHRSQFHTDWYLMFQGLLMLFGKKAPEGAATVRKDA